MSLTHPHDKRNPKIIPKEWVSDYTSQPARKIDYVSKETVKKAYQKLVAMVKLIGGGLCHIKRDINNCHYRILFLQAFFIISRLSHLNILWVLVRIIHYINAYITGVISRRKEFGMLRSIGATENQLKVMLIYENLYLVAIADIPTDSLPNLYKVHTV